MHFPDIENFISIGVRYSRLKREVATVNEWTELYFS